MDAAHKTYWRIAEVVFGIPLLLAIMLHVILPLSLPHGIVRRILMFVGIVLMISAIAVIVVARREFTKHRQPTDPHQPTSKIITTGIFALSRNPLYLGSAIFMLGLGFALNMVWIMIMLAPSLWLCQIVLIMPEERYLAAKFGDEYHAYMATVQRWFGRSAHPQPKK
ncbi:MAG: isoprenylcysteine carboxylmethyltransferase family protein [Herpetosiphon sp.]|nr:isoprenylcysteine carboxylmethyltransferase family protein [Herpetosiphon sp.]